MIETIGAYQVHLIARTISSSGPWAPYVAIDKFDESIDDFRCVLDKHRVSGERVFATEEEAIAEARRHAMELLPRM
jgi:hypothetical protein